MSGKRDHAAAALRRVKYLSNDLHTPILDEMEAEGLLDRPNNGGTVRAAASTTKFSDKLSAAKNDPSMSAALTFAEGQLRQIKLDGYSEILEGEQISIAKLDRILASSGRENLFKINLKNALHKCGLIID